MLNLQIVPFYKFPFACNLGYSIFFSYFPFQRRYFLRFRFRRFMRRNPRNLKMLRRFFRSRFPVFSILQPRLSFYYRHLEINFLLLAFIVLPIPLGFYYTFLANQTLFWTSLLRDFYNYYRH